MKKTLEPIRLEILVEVLEQSGLDIFKIVSPDIMGKIAGLSSTDIADD